MIDVLDLVICEKTSVESRLELSVNISRLDSDITSLSTSEDSTSIE